MVIQGDEEKNRKEAENNTCKIISKEGAMTGRVRSDTI